MRVSALLRHFALLAGAGFILLGSQLAAADDLQDVTKLITASQFAPALDKVNTFLQAHPKDAQGRFLKGIILTEQGKQAEAIQIFSALTEEFPELPEPYNNLAVIYASQGQYEKARNALELAIHTHPSYGTAHENLGDVYAKLATKSYDKALQLDKNNTGVQTKLNLIKGLFDTRSASTAASAATPAATAATAATSKPDIAIKGSEAAKTAKADSAKPAATAPASAAPAAADGGALTEAVHGWASAWSAKNSDGYLAFYASDFKTPNGESRSDWEKQRRERLSKPGPISVQLADLSVSQTDKDNAQVSFKQKYSSSNLKSTNVKTLYLHRSGDRWLIVEERVRG